MSFGQDGTQLASLLSMHLVYALVLTAYGLVIVPLAVLSSVSKKDRIIWVGQDDQEG